jgi:CheY-like chemotaxis protein
MDAFERLEEQLQNTLTHLHDRDLQPSELLCAVMGCDPQNGPVPVQSAIIQEIEDLHPDSDVPRGAHGRRVYDVMYHRYVLKLTLEETAELLGLSVRHLNRLQRDAVHSLARILWERSRAREPLEGDRAESRRMQYAGAEMPRAQAADWRSQVDRELVSLTSYAPDVVSDVGDVIDGVLQLKSALTSTDHVSVELGLVHPNMVAAIHPSVLRQILIAALRRLARHTSTAVITIFARLEDGNVKIALTGSIATEDRFTKSDLIRDILTPEGVSVQVHMESNHLFLWIEVASVGRTTVLVVDDNPDMVRFYRRSTEGTRYHVIHAAQGQHLLETIEVAAPDAIVLDVMLPDVDGWQLLMHLRETHATRAIPVIVCSVVREEDLALSLGAALYLPKPVRRREFIQALDQVLAQALAGAPRSQASNGAAC